MTKILRPPIARTILWSRSESRKSRNTMRSTKQQQIAPPPNLKPLVEAQGAAAKFYILLTMTYVAIGMFLLSAPMFLTIAREEISTVIRIGGVLVAALGAFPSTKYLQRKDRAFALEMIALEYDRLTAQGLLTGPARTELDKMISHLLKGMMR